MQPRHLILLGLTAGLGCGRASPGAPAPPAAGGDLRFDATAVDRSADPCHDFYDYACGGWRASHPIPADRSRWTRYAELQAVNLDRERAIVDGARTGTTAEDRRIAAYQAACIDQPAIEARGLAPLEPLLARIDGAQRPADLAELLAELHDTTAPVLFSVEVIADRRDTSQTRAWIEPGAMGLDEIEDYTRDDTAALRERYRALVAQILGRLGARDPAGDAARVVELELALARAVPDAVSRRDSEAELHPMAGGGLASHAALDWAGYFTRRGIAMPDELNVPYPGWLDALGAQLAADRMPAIRAYLRFHVARALAPVLPRAIDEALLAFERAARGSREPPPRWKRCLALLDRDLGDDVGRRFVARWFSRASRDRAAGVVTRLAGALRSELATSDWLGPAARDAATRKLDNIKFLIGYPDRWRSYEALAIRADDPVGNALAATRLNQARELAKIGRPTNRDEFYALPQQLSGSSAPALVVVELTAGFLQPPVFDAGLDDPVNFGGFGAVVGHEITHHFDDDGRKFGVDGSLAPWWAEDDVARYQARAQCFVDEYSHFRIDDGTPVDGRLTLGENLADNGGLQLAWRALAPLPAGPPRDGFSPAQRFFLAWAQIRCENVTPEAARRQVHSDGHSPGRWRVNGVVRNMPEFAAAFSCRAGAPMAPEARCRLW